MISTYIYSNKGTRTINEDFANYNDHESYGIWVLGDGLGGQQNSEVASEAAVTALIDHMNLCENGSSKYMLEGFYKANEAVRELQKSDIHLKEAMTTLVAVSIFENHLDCIHIGDSRFYYFKKGCLTYQTTDHSVSQMAVMLGEIAPEDIRFHADRNRLLKVIGSHPDIKPDIMEPAISVEPGDAFLLCSDGFWEFVYEIEMEFDLIKSNSPKEWAEHMLIRLLNRRQNEMDNYTVICCFVI